MKQVQEQTPRQLQMPSQNRDQPKIHSRVSAALPAPGRDLRRVRSSPSSQVTVIQPDGLDLCLACWKSWMAADPDRDLGVKTMRGLIGDGDGRGMDSHEAQQAADNRVGAATDAMIESLARIHKWAIYTSCSVSTAWRFPNADLALVAVAARQELETKLKRNSCTSVLF